MFREIMVGARTYPRAWRLAWSEKLWPILMVPGLMGVLYFPIGMAVTFECSNLLAGYIRDYWLPQFLKHEVFTIFLLIALWAMAFYLAIILFTNVILIICSPLFTYLSRKTEEKLARGAKIPEDAFGLLKGTLRAIIMGIASLAVAVLCFGFCLGLLLIPVLGQIAMAVLLPITQMLLAGHSFVDFTLERRGFGVLKSFGFAARHRYRLLGCGAVFVLLALVPIIGWFIGPTLGVVAGTILALETVDSTQSRNLQPARTSPA
jgi:uncharacterized protein involved in cysteine biosynthesis